MSILESLGILDRSDRWVGSTRSSPGIGLALPGRRVSSALRHTWFRRPVGSGGSIGVVIMSVMVDKGGKPAPRTGTERIRKLAQAALNADVTVEQVDTILEGLSETLVDLNNSTGNLDTTLERFNETINQINELAPRLFAVVDRLEAIVGRVERIVDIGEAAVAPIAATESAVRGVVNRMRRTAGL